MFRLLFVFFVSLVFVLPSRAQLPVDSPLYQIILHQDSLLFGQGFNQCNMDILESLVSEDLEFYHDQIGITETKRTFIDGLKNGICNLPYRPQRVLTPHHSEIYPLYKNNQLYAAIQNGIHRFYAHEKGRDPYLTSEAKFTHLWLLTNEQWQLKRILSFDHQAAASVIKNLEKQAFAAFENSPKEAIHLFMDVAALSTDLKDYNKAAITQLNIAGIYDEYLDDAPMALKHAAISLDLRTTQKDSMQMANLLKYTGLLKNKLGKHAPAIQDIQSAIAMFESLNFAKGVAVSEFNLAQVYFEKKEYPKSKNLFEKVINFWKKEGNNDRVFSNNIFGVELYNAIGDKTKARALFEENKSLAPNVEVNTYLQSKMDELQEKYGY